ncbi:3-oxoacyl-acp reductase [hydrocarbon metagenome]|uniref:3-oxoacyl-acp reductase n=1 Tax=hydrocarbon metagenome TaxID=938273 RepID=A0A0W8E805_9ZZZZ
MALSIDLSGKVAIVTGAGRGIGRSIALALAEAGADVAVAARTLSQVEETRDLILSKGCRSMALSVDVAQNEQVIAMVDEIVKTWGGVHILINNAGITRPAPLLEYPEENWDMVININVKGMFLCTKAVGAYMKEQKYGKIINIASTGGEMAGPNNAVYHASKAAAILFTKSVALEWIRYNINVNAIGPGFVNTDLIEDFKDEKARQKLLKVIPIRRFADPDEIAPLAVFLASDLANYMVGEHVIIDGGLIST